MMFFQNNVNIYMFDTDDPNIGTTEPVRIIQLPESFNCEIIEMPTTDLIYNDPCFMSTAIAACWGRTQCERIIDLIRYARDNNYIFIIELLNNENNSVFDMIVCRMASFEVDYSDHNTLKVCFLRDIFLEREIVRNLCERLQMAKKNTGIVLRNQEMQMTENNGAELTFTTQICKQLGGYLYGNPTVNVPLISNIFYNKPYTTIKWFDGTTTTVRASNDDEFNKEFGLAMALAKKYYETLGVPYPRAAFKQAVYVDAIDQTEKTAQRREYKQNKKNRYKRNKNGNVSNGKKSSKR